MFSLPRFRRPSLSSSTRLGLAGVGLALIGGCAQQPTPEPGPPPVSAEAFETRIASLESRLMERCETRLDWEDRQARLGRYLLADIRVLGDRLHGMQEALDRRAEEPTLVASQCEGIDSSQLEGKQVLGRSEWIGLPEVGTYLKARVDSGANTSSLSAREITPFERDGQNWVRFKLGLTEDDVVVDGIRNAWIEAPVERRVRILQAAGSESRPVVSLVMTLGPIRQPVEFTLNDRSHLNYPVLLGRRFMMDIAVIDVAETYLHQRPEFPGGRPADEAAVDEALDRDDSDP
ncbi:MULTISPECIES: ATP-dependent zinc protease family protein [Halomonadaceae]|uniref:ATP-dependent zinc protease family protein n=1 Tax=Halomonas TaxID=2745 RepID=UPI0018A74DDC|nr:ATP-dependent zinc protease [Halomonas sp. 328]MBF8221624.1 ATP-dependent zinc protease [Halomonas sp. 328]